MIPALKGWAIVDADSAFKRWSGGFENGEDVEHPAFPGPEPFALHRKSIGSTRVNEELAFVLAERARGHRVLEVRHVGDLAGDERANHFIRVERLPIAEAGDLHFVAIFR